MPVLKVYRTDLDKEPFIIFSGAIWVWELKTKQIEIQYKDFCKIYACEVLEASSDGLVYCAYGEIVPKEENPEEVINF